MIGYNDVISFFRNTQWLIGIVPSVITFFTARWLFNRKVLKELNTIKDLVTTKEQYTGETSFKVRFTYNSTNHDSRINIGAPLNVIMCGDDILMSLKFKKPLSPNWNLDSHPLGDIKPFYGDENICILRFRGILHTKGGEYVIQFKED